MLAVAFALERLTAVVRRCPELSMEAASLPTVPEADLREDVEVPWRVWGAVDGVVAEVLAVPVEERRLVVDVPEALLPVVVLERRVVPVWLLWVAVEVVALPLLRLTLLPVEELRRV